MKDRSFFILGAAGRFFRGEIPGTVCFVPNSLVSGGKLDEGLYVLQGWASLNIKTQPVELRVGSHLFPDLTKPCDKPTCKNCHDPFDATWRSVCANGAGREIKEITPSLVGNVECS